MGEGGTWDQQACPWIEVLKASYKLDLHHPHELGNCYLPTLILQREKWDICRVK